jgi:hypothetical protein
MLQLLVLLLAGLGVAAAPPLLTPTQIDTCTNSSEWLVCAFSWLAGLVHVQGETPGRRYPASCDAIGAPTLKTRHHRA